MKSMRLFLILVLFSAFMLLDEAYRFTDETDRHALLDFKSQVSEGKRVVLSSWNNSSPLCNWKGVECGRKHKRVTGLDLGGLQLGGVVSPSIGNLSFLIQLSLFDNSFGGTIPQEMGNLFRLEYLDMSLNFHIGVIPIGLFNCSRLGELYLDSNHLSGSFPSEVGLLTKLLYLNLHQNNLKGNLPASLANLTSLRRLGARDNRLEGGISDDIARLTHMVFFSIGQNNFSGPFPPALYNLSSLEVLDIFKNRFSGGLRSDFGKLLPNLVELEMAYNYLTGVIPTSLANISTLQKLAINDNKMTGSIPLGFGRLRNFKWLLLQSNSLGNYSSSDLDFIVELTNCTKLESLEISKNRLGGNLPTSIANLSTNVVDLSLGLNFISGSIPHDIGNLINLRNLIVFKSMLTGVLPTSISKLSRLEKLYLNSNKLSGEIPSFIGNLTRLDMLYLDNNRFGGTIPLHLGNCTSLRLLSISYNKLDGAIPQEIMQIQPLYELDMSANFLTGSLPEDVGQLENLVTLSVEYNKLSGQVPNSLGKCLSIENLRMRENYFVGTIPDIRGLKGVISVDFSNNNFSGSIPAYFANFSSLEYLNLSINNLEGSVPKEGKFQNATIISVFGNKNLCGGIKEFKLKPCFIGAPLMGSKHSSRLKKVVIGVSIGMALLVVIFASLVYLCWFRKIRKTDYPTPSTMDVYHEKISYGEIRNATDGFSSENMIGSGSFGTVFKALLPTANKVVAVKVLNMQRRGAMKSFMAECESLKNIRHRNLVKLVTACSSIDFQGNEFRALIYEFMPNGNLDMWLHPEEVEEIRRPSRALTLLERLNIAIDVASVLEYLHIHCHEPIAHCDLKPSNVLLENDLTAHVSDFGLAQILLKLDQESFLNQLSSASVRGTIGYAAPEYGMGGQPSIKGDAYSFGVLLLEIFTGKRPTNEIFGGNFTLHSYTKLALSERVLDIVDQLILDSGLRVGFPAPECLTLVLEVGLMCCEENPLNRLAMSEAAKELISIKERFFKVRRTVRR